MTGGRKWSERQAQMAMLAAALGRREAVTELLARGGAYARLHALQFEGRFGGQPDGGEAPAPALAAART